MSFFTSIGRLVQRLIRGSVNRLWVQPIETLLIPRLSIGKPNQTQSLLLGISLLCAAAGRVVLEELHLNIICWSGPDWSVTYIGNGFSAEILEHILFPEPPETRGTSRVYLWQVPRMVRKFTGEGDLVVCELSRIIHLSPQNAGLSFTTPQWLKQVIDGIDQPIDETFSNIDRHTRRRIRRLESQNYNFATTHSEADFELFYYRMYTPYVEARHGGRGAIVRSYDFVHSCFENGTLLMIRQNGEPISGSIFQLKEGACVGAQMGVIDGRIDLVKQDANIAMWWQILNWAHEHGAHRFDLGGSRPMTTDGAFVFKRQWGAKVIRYQEIYSQWKFFGKDIHAKLRDHLNEQGFISEISGKHFQVRLLDPVKSAKEIDLAHTLNTLARCGLAGIVTISTNGERRFIRSIESMPDPVNTSPLEVQQAVVREHST